MAYPNTLGSDIRTLRKEMHWTQDQLAEAAGIHKNSIISFETGKRQMYTDTFLLVLDAMGYELAIRKKAQS